MPSTSKWSNEGRIPTTDGPWTKLGYDTWLHFFYIVSCQTKKKDEDKGNVIKGPMRLRKEEGLQMVVREGEQSTKTRTKEKKPNLS